MSTYKIQSLHCNNGAAINYQTKSSGRKVDLDTSNTNLNQQRQQIKRDSVKKDSYHFLVGAPDQIDLKYHLVKSRRSRVLILCLINA